MRELERSVSSIWLQTFVRFRRWISARSRLLALGALGVLFAVLLTPSIWMLSTIPPLWRDVDAYVQVTQPPGLGTILQYGPLYCFVARIPLYFGYAIDCVGARAPLPTPSFFVHPILTDSGVFVLHLSQHILLCFATFHVIAVATRLFWVRLALAVAWATNPLFYTFAHCIGTETLSTVSRASDCGNRTENYWIFAQDSWERMASFRYSFMALYPDSAHQRHSGCAAATYLLPPERISANHDQIRSISVTSPLATITGEAGLTKSSNCCRCRHQLHRPS